MRNNAKKDMKRNLKYNVSLNNGEKYAALIAPTISHAYPGLGHHDERVLLHVANHVLPAPPDEDDTAP